MPSFATYGEMRPDTELKSDSKACRKMFRGMSPEYFVARVLLACSITVMKEGVFRSIRAMKEFTLSFSQASVSGSFQMSRHRSTYKVVRIFKPVLTR